MTYSVTWRQNCTCCRGGKPRYKASSQPKSGKVRNAPGSRLMGCDATINVRLLKLNGDEILQINFPLPSAHTNHSPDSLADLQSHKPLPEVMAKVESLISHSHLSQISLLLALKSWVNQELIPQHIQQGILTSKPAEYNRQYYPTVEDVRNMSRRVINKIRNNMFDQDALETFLRRESEESRGLKYFLRKYKGSEESIESTGKANDKRQVTSLRLCICRYNYYSSTFLFLFIVSNLQQP